MAWMLLGATLAILAPLGTACAGPAPSPSVQAIPADAAARDFYRWYVGLMAKDKDPGDDPQAYARFVSTALRARIKRQIDGADGMEVDYFIKAQDYRDSWIGHVSATAAALRGASARTVVTLGPASQPWRLNVVLVREDGRWKISAVTRG